MITPEERYCNDVLFRSLVDFLTQTLLKTHITISDIRDAAELAEFISKATKPIENNISPLQHNTEKQE